VSKVTYLYVIKGVYKLSGHYHPKTNTTRHSQFFQLSLSKCKTEILFCFSHGVTEKILSCRWASKCTHLFI